MNNNIYFRALCSTKHVSEWRSRSFNSYHHTLPGIWQDAYYRSGCREFNCFPLRFMEGNTEVEYTESARFQFLKYASKYKSSEKWLPEQIKLSSELNGICAFDNEKDAYDYGSNSLAGRQESDLYVVFKGEEICTLPENNGYVVKVVEIIDDIIASDFFKSKYLPDLV